MKKKPARPAGTAPAEPTDEPASRGKGGLDAAEWGRLYRRVRTQENTDSGASIYLVALQAAIYQGNRVVLLQMLKRGVPVPRELLPALAEAMRVASHTDGGRPRIFLPSFEDGLRLMHWKKMRFGELKFGAAVQEIVDELSPGMTVSNRTIENIIRKKWRPDEPVAEIARLLLKNLK